ncbi:PREDICTED: ras-related protein Rab-23-like, partial [Apaloderma vittatum]|uniref:ras-related protein Rab-23-like n=1 Tax=Apaloderma vittatum TaxID=57397 RepID=UPI000521BFD4
MLEEDMEVAIKVVVVGNGAVGKSSMIQRYCKGIFTKDYKKTIGVDFLERQIQVNDEDVRLMLWDTAGQEEFDAITKAYYRALCSLDLCLRDIFTEESAVKQDVVILRICIIDGVMDVLTVQAIRYRDSFALNFDS